LDFNPFFANISSEEERNQKEMPLIYRYTVTVTESTKLSPVGMMLQSILIVVTAFMAMELIMNIIDSIMKNKEDKAETERQDKTDKIYKC